MLIGKYQLLRKLATGGMAEVFLAKASGPLGFEKTLVLKRILPHLAEDPTFVEMFLSEAKLAAQLNHPHIVQIFDFGEAEGSYYLAMEYIDGPNLRVLARRARKLGVWLSPMHCARLIANACEGLAFAHDFADPATGQPLGLVHRDISPDNILVSRQGAVKVVDFGIAKAAGQSHHTQAGLIKGKLAYMSPEQLRTQKLDRRVDVYALGVVLYELLTGRKPFEGTTMEGLVNAILFKPPVPAVELRPELPEAVQRILDRALARNREQRYPNCRALQMDLEEFILSTGKPLGAYQLSQLVIQVTAHVDTPSPTPVPASPPHGLATAHTGSVEKSLSVIERRLSTPKPARLPFNAAKTVQLRTPAFPNPSPASVTTPSPVSNPARETRVKGAAPHSWNRRGGWLPALVGVTLLAAGGGYLLARASRPHPLPTPAPALEAPAEDSEVLPSSSSFPAPALEPLIPTSTVTSMALNPAAPVVPDADEPPKSLFRSRERTATTSTGRRTTSRAGTSKVEEPSARRMGTLRLVVRGWADIRVDGQNMGRVPPTNELELTAGRHELELVNPALEKPYRAFVTITAGKTLEHRVTLQSTTAAR